MDLSSYRVEDCRRAIHERNGDVRALLRVLDEPQRDARAKESAPLYGVPYVLKDTWDTAGIITTGGSWRHRERVPRESGSIHRVLAAGRRGAPRQVEHARPRPLDRERQPPRRRDEQPVRPDAHRGGSTGGGAAAIATGMAAFDWGGDFGGSIRSPAACCGIVGIRLSSAAWPASKEQFPDARRVLPPDARDGAAREERGVLSRRDARGAGDARRRGDADDAIRTTCVLYAPDARDRGRVADVRVRRRAAPDAGGRPLRHRPHAPPPPGGERSLQRVPLRAHGRAQVDQRAPRPRSGRRGRSRARVAGAARSPHPHEHRGAAAPRADREPHDLPGSLALRRRRRSPPPRDGRDLARAGKLVIAPTATVPPPKHGRGIFTRNWQSFTKLGNLTDATAVALPFGTLRRAGSPARSR